MSKQQPILLTVRRVDGAYRVLAHELGLEHTHSQEFRQAEDAYRLRAEIRRGVAGGFDLTLGRFWSTEEVDECHYRQLHRSQGFQR
jgi:hypothetical protein